jgi:hypothetical protein
MYPVTSYTLGIPSYSTLPGGIILQTGYVTLTQVVNAQVSQTVTFPKSFPTACCSIVLSIADTGPGYNTTNTGAMPQLITTRNFLCVTKYISGSPQTGGYGITVYWQAIGF